MSPRYLEVLINQAYVLGEVQNKPADALEVLDRTLERFPDDVHARGGRAVVLARLGRSADAAAEVKKALALRSRPDDLLRAASAFAVLSPKDGAAAAEAIKLLGQALQAGEGYTLLDADLDLAYLKADKSFQRLAEAARVVREAAAGRLKE